MMKLLTILVTLVSLTACYESAEVTLHEPGVYKGKTDKHALSAEEREKVLKKRFLHVQTDR